MKKELAVLKSENINAVFYNKNGALIMRTTEDKEYIIQSNANECFNLVPLPKGDILIFYKDTLGGAYLSKVIPAGRSGSRRLMPCAAFTSSSNCIFCQTKEYGSCFFYSLPSKEKNVVNLYVTDFSDDEGILIDTAKPIKDIDFFTTGNENPAIVYKNKQNALILCVFEGKTLSDFKTYTITQKGENISDVSCLWENKKIHISYTTTYSSSSHLIYRQLSGSELSAPRVLNTQKVLNSCLVFISNDNLFIFSTSRNLSYYTFSKDMGSSFYPSAVYFKQLNVTSKAQYTCTGNIDFKASEIYMNGISPLLLEDFASAAPSKPPEFTEEDVIRLRSKIINFEKEIKDRNSQVTEMSKTVSQTQQQNSLLLQQWKLKYTELNNEYEKLKNSISAIEKEKETLISQLSFLKEEQLEKEKKINRLTDENNTLKKAKSLLESEIYRINNINE